MSNSTEQFQWTDELVKEYGREFGYAGEPDIEEFKNKYLQSKQPSPTTQKEERDYELDNGMGTKTVYQNNEKSELPPLSTEPVPHKCKYCGVQTVDDDEKCYMNPLVSKSIVQNSAEVLTDNSDVAHEEDALWFNPQTSKASKSLPEITSFNDVDGCYLISTNPINQKLKNP